MPQRTNLFPLLTTTTTIGSKLRREEEAEDFVGLPNR